MSKVMITTQGKKELESKIKELNDRLKELLKEKAVAYENSGDGWHDNPGWIQIGQTEERFSKELAEMQSRLNNAKIIESKPDKEGSVQIGSIVLIKQNMPKLSRELTIEIVGSHESNLSKGRIAYDTPIGLAIVGSSVGESVDFLAPAGKMKINILKLFNSWEDANNYKIKNHG